MCLQQKRTLQCVHKEKRTATTPLNTLYTMLKRGANRLTTLTQAKENMGFVSHPTPRRRVPYDLVSPSRYHISAPVNICTTVHRSKPRTRQGTRTMRHSVVSPARTVSLVDFINVCCLCSWYAPLLGLVDVPHHPLKLLPGTPTNVVCICGGS